MLSADPERPERHGRLSTSELVLHRVWRSQRSPVCGGASAASTILGTCKPQSFTCNVPKPGFSTETAERGLHLVAWGWPGNPRRRESLPRPHIGPQVQPGGLGAPPRPPSRGAIRKEKKVSTVRYCTGV